MMTITESAQKRIKELTPAGQRLRISIVGGGCSGFTYELKFEPADLTWTAKDRPISDDPDVVTDSRSVLFLNDVTLDYSDGLNGKGFEFKNPTAKRTCGCGTSFSP